MNPKFNLGDKVFWATIDYTETYIECPDCGGTGRIRVIFHDDTIASIECEWCKKGFNAPTGAILKYEYLPRVRSAVITGMELIAGRKIEYRTNTSHCILEGDLFTTESEAQARSQQLVAERDREELERLNRKEKNNRSWAWHASYHRSEIKKAKERIAYHESRLNVASLKAKEVEVEVEG